MIIWCFQLIFKIVKYVLFFRLHLNYLLGNETKSSTCNSENKLVLEKVNTYEEFLMD